MLNGIFHEGYNNLGNSLQNAGNCIDASLSYKRSIALSPNFAFAYNNLGVTAKEIRSISRIESKLLPSTYNRAKLF